MGQLLSYGEWDRMRWLIIIKIIINTIVKRAMNTQRARSIRNVMYGQLLGLSGVSVESYLLMVISDFHV